VLRSMADSARMPHALLILGPSGCGALPLAMAYSQYVICKNKADGEACGSCGDCTKASKYIHPDIHFSYPVAKLEKQKDPPISTLFIKEWRKSLVENPYMNVNQWLEKLGAENKQGNITAKECVEIVKKLSLKTFEASHKVLILWLPEYLGNEGNRLLKLIEEPPDDTLFILVAENQEKILNTILSRCQLIQINGLTDQDITAGLLDRGIPKEDALSLAHLSDGDLNEAIRLASNEENDNANLFLNWMRACYKGHGAELVDWSDKMATIGRERQKLLFKYSLHFLHELMIMNLTGNEDIRLRNNELTTAKGMNGKVLNFDKITKLTGIFDQCSYHIERNANPKILFLETGIRVNKIMKS
jgi:DNA polymerase III subunit delta'